MVRTRECDFCGDEIEAGTGTMFVRVDGSTEHFCSSKCEHAADLGREARNLGWTEAGKAAAEANRREGERQAERAAQETAEAAADEDAAAEASEAGTDDEDESATDADEEEEEPAEVTEA